MEKAPKSFPARLLAGFFTAIDAALPKAATQK
jgi:hypothetical protein